MLPYLLLLLACVVGGEAQCTSTVCKDGCHTGQGTAGEISELKQLVMNMRAAQNRLEEGQTQSNTLLKQGQESLKQGQQKLEDKIQAVVSTSGCTTAEHPRNCQDVLDKGYTQSGVYTIQTFGDRPGLIEVYCDQKTDGGGWLVFQRRQDGKEDFYRRWTEYLDGFGDITKEFWLGNIYLHQFTDSKPMELRVDLSDFNNTWRYAHYKEFSVGPERENFTLSVGIYNGNAGNSLGGHNGAMFSTWDMDNDIHSSSCARLFHGAWWYTKCHSSNLNGKYLAGPHESYADGVEWGHWLGQYYSLKHTEMKMRPA